VHLTIRPPNQKSDSHSESYGVPDRDTENAKNPSIQTVMEAVSAPLYVDSRMTNHAACGSDATFVVAMSLAPISRLKLAVSE